MERRISVLWGNEGSVTLLVVLWIPLSLFDDVAIHPYGL